MRNIVVCSDSDLTRTIFLQLCGGLGNQMFQYAAGYTAAVRSGCRLLCDLRWFASQGKRAFQLDKLCVPIQYADSAQLADIYSSERWISRSHLRNALNRVLGWASGENPPVSLTRFAQAAIYDPAIFQLQCPAFLEGYFQSWRYFELCNADIRRFYRPAEQLSENTSRHAQSIASAACPIALHVRRGDYGFEKVTHDYHGLLSADYYRAALRIVESLAGGQGIVFVFSDDAESAKILFDGRKNVVFISGNEDRPWEDIYLMSLCRHFIVANSSFSWWGAWLSGSVDKIVVAPRAWYQPDVMRKQSTIDLIPPGWITV